MDHAQAWAAAAIEDYNNNHHHSSLEGHTPASMHTGAWVTTHHRWQTTLNELAARNPQRWRHQPTLATPYATVRLNMEQAKQRLQTA